MNFCFLLPPGTDHFPQMGQACEFIAVNIELCCDWASLFFF